MSPSPTRYLSFEDQAMNVRLQMTQKHLKPLSYKTREDQLISPQMLVIKLYKKRCKHLCLGTSHTKNENTSGKFDKATDMVLNTVNFHYYAQEKVVRM